jgi:cation transporter-like permease
MLILFWLQLLFANLALHLPLCIAGIFYITIAYSWKKAIFWAILCGICIDFLYQRELFISTSAFLATVIFAEYWLRKNDMNKLKNSFLPGSVIALLSVLPIWIYKLFFYHANILYVIKDMLAVTIFSLIFGIFFLPLLVVLLDAIATRLNLTLYTKSNKRLFKQRAKITKNKA